MRCIGAKAYDRLHLAWMEEIASGKGLTKYKET